MIDTTALAGNVRKIQDSKGRWVEKRLSTEVTRNYLVLGAGGSDVGRFGPLDVDGLYAKVQAYVRAFDVIRKREKKLFGRKLLTKGQAHDLRTQAERLVTDAISICEIWESGSAWDIARAAERFDDRVDFFKENRVLVWSKYFNGLVALEAMWERGACHHLKGYSEASYELHKAVVDMKSEVSEWSWNARRSLPD